MNHLHYHFTNSGKLFAVDMRMPKGKRLHYHWFRAELASLGAFHAKKEMIDEYVSSKGATLNSFQTFLSRTVGLSKVSQKGLITREEKWFIGTLANVYEFQGKAPMTAKRFETPEDFESWVTGTFKEHLGDLVHKQMVKQKTLLSRVHFDTHVDNFNPSTCKILCYFQFDHMFSASAYMRPEIRDMEPYEARLEIYKFLEACMQRKRILALCDWAPPEDFIYYLGETRNYQGDGDDVFYCEIIMP